MEKTRVYVRPCHRLVTNARYHWHMSSLELTLLYLCAAVISVVACRLLHLQRQQMLVPRVLQPLQQLMQSVSKQVFVQLILVM